MLDRYRKSWMDSMIAIAAVAQGAIQVYDAPRIYPLTPRVTKWDRPHQGVTEMARRCRLIVRGKLTASNGLAV